MVFIDFFIVSHPIRLHATIIGSTEPYAKPIKFIIKLYANHNTLLVKRAIH